MVNVKPTIVGFQAFRKQLKTLSNTAPVSRALHARLAGTWRAGAAEFIKAAITEILIDTGMSAATFFPLARLVKRGSLGQLRNFIRTNKQPQSGPKFDRPEFPAGARNIPPRIRSIPAGADLGQGAFTLDVGTPDRPIFTFTFETVVFQFAFHERQQKSLPKGEQAFRAHIQKNFVIQAREIIQKWFDGENLNFVTGIEI